MMSKTINDKPDRKPCIVLHGPDTYNVLEVDYADDNLVWLSWPDDNSYAELDMSDPVDKLIKLLADELHKQTWIRAEDAATAVVHGIKSLGQFMR